MQKFKSDTTPQKLADDNKKLVKSGSQESRKSQLQVKITIPRAAKESRRPVRLVTQKTHTKKKTKQILVRRKVSQMVDNLNED